MLGRLAARCTGPRVALLALLATASMVLLLMRAELPMVSAMTVGMALQKASPDRHILHKCDPAVLAGEDEPMRSFDSRLLGYGPADARTILCAMEANGSEGKRLYLERHFPLDVLFAALYGPAIAALYLWLLRAHGRKAGPLCYFALIPLAGAALDIAENIAVRTIVVAGFPLDTTAVALASGLTVGKYILIGSGMAVTMTLLLRYLITRSFGRGAGSFEPQAG
jgi:hypothetical protein